jgi:hypothetical protein
MTKNILHIETAGGDHVKLLSKKIAEHEQGWVLDLILTRPFSAINNRQYDKEKSGKYQNERKVIEKTRAILLLRFFLG